MLVDGNCFHNLKQLADHNQALNSCKNNSLAILDSGAKSYHARQMVGASEKAFIGLMKDGSIWKWGDGRVNDKYFDWKAGHPSSTNQFNCSVVSKEGWEDVDCNSLNHGLCEEGQSFSNNSVKPFITQLNTLCKEGLHSISSVQILLLKHHLHVAKVARTEDHAKK